MTKKKPSLPINKDNKGSFKPLIILVIISILIAIILPKVQEAQKFTDTEV
jgi:competence protein ComGC